MAKRPRCSKLASLLLVATGLVLPACQTPLGTPSQDPTPDASPILTSPEPSPTPSTGNVEPIITF